MNGDPNAEQKRYHDDLREMYYETQGDKGLGELHHIWGSKENFKLLKEAGIVKPGEWFVEMIPKTTHDNIKSFSFEYQKDVFLAQQRDYHRFFDRPSPVPAECLTYITALLSKQYILKVWP